MHLSRPYALLGPSIAIPESLQGVDPHLVALDNVPKRYNPMEHRFKGSEFKVATIPDNHDTLMRWSYYFTDGAARKADALGKLSEGASQWERLESTGLMKVVAHRHIYAGPFRHDPTKGAIMTAAERLRSPANLDPQHKPEHAEPAITAISGLAAYMRLTLDLPHSYIAQDIFHFEQLSAIPPGGSVRPDAGSVILHDVGHEFVPTFEKATGKYSLFTKDSVRRLSNMANITLEAARGTTYEDAARLTVVDTEDLYATING